MMGLFIPLIFTVMGATSQTNNELTDSSAEIARLQE